MTQHKHIINKQIIEIQLPKKADAFGIQQKLGKLYSEQFTPIIDKLLCDRYGSDVEKRYQIDQLTVDLGNVQIENLAEVFTEKFSDALIAIEAAANEENGIEKKEDKSPKTPIQLVSYYLKNGRLPWWSSNTTKAYVLEQLDRLIKTPDTTFTKLLVQLPLNHTYLDRFLYTFTEDQVLSCLQLLTDISVQGLSKVKKELQDRISKNTRVTHLTIENTFWKTAFTQITTAEDYEVLKERCSQKTLLELGVDLKNEGKENRNKNVYAIRSLVEKYKTQYSSDTVWQQFFQQTSKLVNAPYFYKLDANLQRELKQLLLRLNVSQNNSQEPINTETKLQPITRHLQIVRATLKPLQQGLSTSAEIETLQSSFEDADFITIQNSGLVLLWPFLQRFFENLEVMKDKAFHNETARNKAVCAFQYVCETVDAEFFEAMLPLTKVLCGVPLDDMIPPIPLSETEKQMADKLLNAVIARGPHWRNLSLDGFRTSYLSRQGSLRKRDDHWLLQVKKETYDVTLEKLPWGFTVVKLPWMQAVLMVEWM